MKELSLTSTWLTMEQVTKEYGLSKSWLYKKTAKREIPHYKPGGKIYFRKDDLEKWITDSLVKTKQQLIQEQEL